MKEIKSVMNSEKVDISDFASVGEYVYAEIRRQIISWKLKPGQRISEAEMSKVLDVSRTPVREGFLRLKNEGLVEILSQRGTIISKIDLRKVRESVFIRNCLEKEMIMQISGQLTDEEIAMGRKFLKKQKEALESKDYYKFHKYDVLFHKLFFEAADKTFTWEFLYITDAQYDRVRMLTLLDYDKFRMLLDDHTVIFESIIQGNHKVAVERLLDHINLIFEELEVLKNEYEEYFIHDNG